MIIEQVESKEQLKAFVRLLKEDSDKQGRKVVSELDMLFWRGVPVWVGTVSGLAVTINATYFGKKRANSWEPYANGYTAFTRVSERRKGYAKELNQYIHNLAREKGCRRLKALAGTRLGYYFHRSFGDQIWGVNDKRMLLVDTPLVDPSQFTPNTTPISVRKWTDRTTPMTEEEIAELLREPLHYEL